VRNQPDSILGSFLETDDASRDMPAGTVELVGTPREQRAAVGVLYQQVDVDERRDSAQEKEHVVGQVAAAGFDCTLQLSYRVRETAGRASQS